MVYLENTQHELLKRRSIATGSSMAELIRKAVNLYMGIEHAAPDLSFVGSASGPRNGDTSERDEEILRQIFT